MGQAYDSKGEYDRALEYYQQALAIKKATLGDNHPKTAVTLNAMGEAYSSRGEYESAVEYDQQDLAN